MNKKLSAVREFTDREPWFTTFQRALKAPQPAMSMASDAYRVLVWHGSGGQGKSGLCAEIQKRMPHYQSTVELGVASFDFEQHNTVSLVDCLFELRWKLRKTANINFITFDYALISLFKLEKRSRPLQDVYPGLLTLGSPIIDWIIETGAEFCGIGSLFKKSQVKLDQVRIWWQHDEVKQRVHAIDAIADPHTLRQLLPEILGFDLQRALQSTTNLRIVILLDTYERLWANEQHKESVRVDDWIRQLILRSPGVLYAIFSRHKLAWENIDPAWESRLEQHVLDGLSQQDSKGFLERAGVHQKEARLNNLWVIPS